MKKIFTLVILAVCMAAILFKSCIYIGQKAKVLNAPSKMYVVYGKLAQLDPKSVQAEFPDLSQNWKKLSNDEYKRLLSGLNVQESKVGSNDQLYYDPWGRPYIVSIRVGDKQDLEWELVSLGPSGVLGSADNYQIKNYKINHY